MAARMNSSVGRVLAKMRLQTAIFVVLGRVPRLLLVLCVLALGLRWGSGGASLFWAASGLGLLIIALLVWRALRPLNAMQAALLVDRHFGFEGRFATAYEFSNRDGEVPSGFAHLVLSQGARLFPFSAGDAQRIVLPPTGLQSLALGGLLAVIVYFPAISPETLVQEKDVAPAPVEAALSGDDAELLQERVDKLKAQVRTDEARRFSEELNQLVIQLTDGKLSRSEGFRQAAALEAQLEKKSREAEALARGLAQRGEILQKRGMTEGAGRALTEQRLLDAKEALKKLAERLQAGTDPLSAQELDELRQSLEEVRKQQEEEAAQQKAEESAAAQARSALEKRREELEARKKSGKASSDELRELAETERQLKRLSRKRKQEQAAAQKLSELDKKLAEAARSLAEERKKSGEFLQEAAQKVGEASAQQLTDEEKKELIEQLEALKERLRKQKKDGAQAERMRKFQERARGGRPQGGERKGEGQKRPGRRQVSLSPGGAPIGKPGDQPGSSPSEDGAQKRGQSAGKEAGHAHDERLDGEASRLPQKGYQDKAAAGQDNGQGPSASETIASAAERGFVSGSYQKLYHEYQTVAEEVMEKDRIPPGRRSHVERYFELIRPRETN